MASSESALIALLPLGNSCADRCDPNVSDRTALPQSNVWGITASESAKVLFSFTPGFSPVWATKEVTNRFNGFIRLQKRKPLETVSQQHVLFHRAEARCELEQSFQAKRDRTTHSGVFGS